MGCYPTFWRENTYLLDGKHPIRLRAGGARPYGLAGRGRLRVGDGALGAYVGGESPPLRAGRAGDVLSPNLGHACAHSWVLDARGRWATSHARNSWFKMAALYIASETATGEGETGMPVSSKARVVTSQRAATHDWPSWPSGAASCS